MNFNRFCGRATLLLLAACAGPPAFAARHVVYEPKPGDRIGIINLMDSRFVSARVAMTIFGNDERLVDNDWDIPGQSTRELASQIERKGLVPVVLDPPPGFAELSARTGLSGYGAELKPQLVRVLDPVIRENDLDLLLVLRPVRGQFNPHLNVTYTGYGLGTFRKKPEFAVAFSFVEMLAAGPQSSLRYRGARNCRSELREPDSHGDSSFLGRPITEADSKELAPLRPVLERWVACMLLLRAGDLGLAEPPKQCKATCPAR